MLLRDKDKETLTRIFSQVDLEIEVWAYGSRVNGDAHEGSDLDLVIRGQNLQKIHLKVFLELKDKIQLENLVHRLDLFDWARLPETFHENIETMHEVLYRSK